jgi:hypothetical protein
MLYLTIIRNDLSWTRQIMIRKTWVIRPMEEKPMSSLTKKWIDHRNHEWIEVQELLGSTSCARVAYGRARELTASASLFHGSPQVLRGGRPISWCATARVHRQPPTKCGADVPLHHRWEGYGVGGWWNPQGPMKAIWSRYSLGWIHRSWIFLRGARGTWMWGRRRGCSGGAGGGGDWDWYPKSPLFWLYRGRGWISKAPDIIIWNMHFRGMC